LGIDINDYTEYIVFTLVRGGDTVTPKQWTVRVPEEILEWIREKAALETIKQKKIVSMNAFFVDLLTKAMEADKKKGE